MIRPAIVDFQSASAGAPETGFADHGRTKGSAGVLPAGGFAAIPPLAKIRNLLSNAVKYTKRAAFSRLPAADQCASRSGTPASASGRGSFVRSSGNFIRSIMCPRDKPGAWSRSCHRATETCWVFPWMFARAWVVARSSPSSNACRSKLLAPKNQPGCRRGSAGSILIVDDPALRYPRNSLAQRRASRDGGRRWRGSNRPGRAGRPAGCRRRLTGSVDGSSHGRRAVIVHDFPALVLTGDISTGRW